jgi:hypothetical protein
VPEHHTIKWDVYVELHVFQASVLERSVMVIFTLRPLYSQGKNRSGAHSLRIRVWTEKWRREKFMVALGLEPRPSSL